MCLTWLGQTLAFTEREYLALGANMLTSSLKISDTTKIDSLELICFPSDQKIFEKYCLPDLSKLSDPLTC